MSAYSTSPNDTPPPTSAVDSSGYRTSPSQTETGMPAGVPYIIGNEAAERFSFYGMKSILALFMTHYLVVQGSANGHLSANDAEGYTHYFVAGVYYLPVAWGAALRRPAGQIPHDPVAFHRVLLWALRAGVQRQTGSGSSWAWC